MNIEGILAMPRKSLNNNFYFASELAHEQTVPLRLNHDKTEDGIIGRATLYWDEKTEQLSYSATIERAEVVAEVQRLVEANIDPKVSLGLSAGSDVQLCHSNGEECMNAPVDVNFNEMSLLLGEDPGIPETSVVVIEKKCGTKMVEIYAESFKLNTSISNEPSKVESMSEENTTPEFSAELDAKIDSVVSSRLDARLAQIDADNKAKAEAEKAEADAKAEADKVEAEKEEAKKSLEDSMAELVEKRVAEETAKLEKQFAEAQRKSEIQESSGKVWEEAQVDEQVSLMEKVLDGQSVTIKIDKDEFIDKHSVFQPSPFMEAVSTSGTIPGVDVGSQIVILPGGIMAKSIRPWVQVRKIAQGEDTVRFYTLDIPAFGTITESASSDISAATHTLTGIDLSANTVRGFRQNVLKAEVEKYPKDLLNKIRETARIRAVEDECTIILSTIAAATSQDFGANHFDANDGTLVTDETDEDATGVMKAAGIEAGKVRLQSQGHNAENGAAVLALTPRAQKELIQDTVIVRFIQTADPSISRLGRISMYFGIELFVTNCINTSNNNSARNILFMKGKAFGLAVGREIELEFDKNIRQQSVDIVATHRVNAVVIDATAYCILSSKND
jgi:flagellar biosynthesis GTPase FlhF